MAFAADGSILATTTGNTRTVYLWESTTGKLLRKLSGEWPHGHGLGAVKAVGFAPHAPLFAAGTTRSVTIWRTDTWVPIAELNTNSANIYELAFGPGESPSIAAASSMGVSIWHDAGRPTGDKLRPRDCACPDRGGVSVLDFSPDGTLLVASNCRNATLWNPLDGREVLALQRRPSNHRGAVRFSPNGSCLAVARGKWADLWSPTNGDSPERSFTAGTGSYPAIWVVGWAAGGSVLVTAGADRFVRLWDVATLGELRSFQWSIGKVYCAAFAPDGLICAAGGDKGQVVVWDLEG